jgi:hypothetical protein
MIGDESAEISVDGVDEASGPVALTSTADRWRAVGLLLERIDEQVFVCQLERTEALTLQLCENTRDEDEHE